MNPTVIQSITVGIQVRDIEQAAAWYERIFGKHPEIEPVPGIKEFRLFPGFWLQLMEDEEVEACGSVIRFGVQDIESERERLRELGIEVGAIHTVNGVVAYCNFNDPDGNKLCLYQELLA